MDLNRIYHIVLILFCNIFSILFVLYLNVDNITYSFFIKYGNNKLVKVIYIKIL